MSEREPIAVSQEALEILAAAYEGEGRYCAATDLRNRNISSQGVRWIRTECALAAIQRAMTQAAEDTQERCAKVADEYASAVPVEKVRGQIGEPLVMVSQLLADSIAIAIRSLPLEGKGLR